MIKRASLHPANSLLRSRGSVRAHDPIEGDFLSMANELPPSGGWAGYYLYGHGGSRHCMKLTLTFAANGAIDGDGLDDIATFVITGRFDVVTSAACWTKAYVRMHTVE